MHEVALRGGNTSTEEVEILRGRVRDLENALGQRDEGLANAFKLTPAQTKLLGLLLALPTVKAEIVSQRLEITTDVKVAIFRLRRELKAWDIPIQSKRSLGYWLDDASKKRIKEIVEGLTDVG